LRSDKDTDAKAEFVEVSNALTEAVGIAEPIKRYDKPVKLRARLKDLDRQHR